MGDLKVNTGEFFASRWGRSSPPNEKRTQFGMSVCWERVAVLSYVPEAV
jgi:hypothetical protein